MRICSWIKHFLLYASTLAFNNRKCCLKVSADEYLMNSYVVTSNNQEHRETRRISRQFLVKFLQNWGYDKFSRRNAKVSKFWSHDHIYSIIESRDKILLVALSTKIMASWPLFQNTVILRRPRVTNGVVDFADIIKIATTFIKTTF